MLEDKMLKIRGKLKRAAKSYPTRQTSKGKKGEIKGERGAFFLGNAIKKKRLSHDNHNLHC
jgi:hypothetical protein